MGKICAFHHLSSFTLSPDYPDHNQQSGIYSNWKFNWKHTTPDAINTIVNLKDKNSQLIQYPRFTVNKESYQSPSSFHTPIQLINLTPNQAIYQFNITENILCQCEVLVTSSQQCIQKLILTNLGDEIENTALEWFFFLKGKKHQLFTPWKKNRTSGLYLNIDNLHILSTINGPTKIGQHSIPSLSQHAQIHPGENSTFYIISCLASTQEDCENQLLSINTLNWDAVFVRNELTFKASQIKITCENEDWNTVLAYSQIQAIRLFNSLPGSLNTETISRVEPVLTENSTNPDLSSISQENNSGFSIFTLNYLWYIFGHPYANRFQDLLSLVFQHQRIDGQIYWNIPEPISSLKGNAIPILTSLVWQIYESTQDIEWLTKIYPKLKKFMLSWFSEFNDKDQDGCPEWRNPYQIGFSETLLYQQHPVLLHPYFFRQFEHPGLLSMLIADFRSLGNIAQEINQTDEQHLWQERANMMEQHLQKFRDKENSSYQVLDYFTHQNTEHVHILDGSGEIHNEEKLELEENCRIRMDLVLDGAFTRPVQVKLKGKSGSISIKETINFANMIWAENKGTAISQYTYTMLEKVIIKGIKEEETWQIDGLHFDYHDISMLLPHIEHASKPASQPVYQQHLNTYGLALLSEQNDKARISSMPWNAIILEKLMRKSDLSSAADLISKILNSASIQYFQKNGLYEYYDSDSASGYGDRNHLHGLIPQSLLLNILGIKMMSQEGIYITHFNPFSIPFTVQYKGMILKLFSDSVEIQFRGFITRITQTGYHRIRISTNVVKQS